MTRFSASDERYCQRVRGSRGRVVCERSYSLHEQTEPWGIKVAKVEVKQAGLPQDMQRAIARQAEAEGERRAKIINADGEFQASEKLAEAAAVLAREPITITLRCLQTLAEIGTEKNATVEFPVPVELLSALLGKPIGH